MPLRDYEHMKLPDGITPEEARWYSEQRQQDIDAAVDRAARRWTRRSLTGFLILFVGLVIAVTVGTRQADTNRNAIVESGRVVSVAGCNRDFRTITSQRGTYFRALTVIKDQLKKDLISERQYNLAVNFYETELDKLKLPDCREAEKIVTDDPTKVGPIPEPLYPGGPGDTDPASGG